MPAAPTSPPHRDDAPRRRAPALPILFITGAADRAALDGVSAAQIIGKPFLDKALHDKVRLPRAPEPGQARGTAAH